MGVGGKNKGAMKMTEYAVDKCFECDDFFTCDGQCDEVEAEPQTEEWYTYQDEQEYNARRGKE